MENKENLKDLSKENKENAEEASAELSDETLESVSGGFSNILTSSNCNKK